jgi:hypothetical protein
VDLDRSSKPEGGESRQQTPRKKTWITPTIEEADASELTAKSAGNFEVYTFTKNGS